MDRVFDLIVIGGGAAGFFGAIQTAEMRPGTNIMILEKTSKLLSKVKVSGGGRCNVTHNCFKSTRLSQHYPRGQKVLKQLFKSFQASHTVEWFATKGIELKSESDGRMFPATNNSQTIIDCFLREADKSNILIEVNRSVIRVTTQDDLFTVICLQGETYYCKKILVAIGGSSNAQSYTWIDALGHAIIKPIPSLFTFNDLGKEFKDLMGITVPQAEIKIAGTKFSEKGPLLITHWGLSGPAVIKLSAWAAEYLHQTNYKFTVLVSWIGPVKEDDIRTLLTEHKKLKGKQKVTSNPLFGLPQRLWLRLCELSTIEEQRIWSELPQKNLNRLIEFIIRCPFAIQGKTTFKEEFVTCGGVDLRDINPETMESKKTENLFFAGEVLNMDGETGGFNFQAAWSTAFIAAKAIAEKNKFLKK